MRMYAYTDVNLHYLRMYCAVVLVNTRVTGRCSLNFCHQSHTVSVIPGCPGIPGIRMAVPEFPGMKKHVREWKH